MVLYNKFNINTVHFPLIFGFHEYGIEHFAIMI